MTPVLIDVLQTKTLEPILGAGPLYDTVEHTWPEDRYIIGWAPWIGYNRGMVQEGHLILFTNSGPIFLLGPHKEAPDKMYDLTRPDFFPSGYGVFVPAGSPVGLQLCSSNTGSAPGTNAATGNARIFSIKA